MRWTEFRKYLKTGDKGRGEGSSRNSGNKEWTGILWQGKQEFERYIEINGRLKWTEEILPSTG
jgi:hypothetical protein